jgi:hypothetical protein
MCERALADFDGRGPVVVACAEHNTVSADFRVMGFGSSFGILGG